MLLFHRNVPVASRGNYHSSNTSDIRVLFVRRSVCGGRDECREADVIGTSYGWGGEYPLQQKDKIFICQCQKDKTLGLSIYVHWVCQFMSEFSSVRAYV